MTGDSPDPYFEEMEDSRLKDLPPTIGDVIGIPNLELRERALPIRPGDLTRLLMGQPGISAEDRDRLAHLGPLLGAIFHSEFYERLRELKELYAPLDPDSDYVRLPEFSKVRTEASDDEFLIPFRSALERANYRKLDIDVIRSAIEAPNEIGLNYEPDFSLFEHLDVYVRGFTRIPRIYRGIKSKFLKRTVLLDAYQRMVVLLKFRPGSKLGHAARNDVVYLRMFKDVPHVDLEMHLPEQGTKVKMRKIDQAQIASPLLVGGSTFAFKILAASSISLMNPAMIPVMLAPITASVNSFFGFQRAKHKHLSHMIRSLYYLTLANNSSVLTRLIDSAEEEEYKETMLSYFFLWRANSQGRTYTTRQLDREIEAFLKEKTGIEVNFEIEDATSKLYRLGLAKQDEKGKLVAIPPAEALQTLDRLWDNTFRYAPVNPQDHP